jgi:hypothetical protein
MAGTAPGGGVEVSARRPRVWRIVLLAVAGLIALNLLGSAIDSATGGTPSGPRSSSYATARDGLAAYHDLLHDSGHPTSQLRKQPSDGSLDRSTTLVMLDPRSVLPSEARAIGRFVRAGGHLIAGGARSNDWLDEVVPRPPSWRSGEGPVAAHVLASAPETAGVGAVQTAGEGVWRSAGGTRPVLGSRDALLTVADVGEGHVALLADASPLQNRLLDQADNAALGLALAGSPERRVVFAESVHGYGRETGLAALPERWKWTLIGLLLAAIAWVASRIRRLGPAEDETRPLPPPRRAYVDAVAATLARTHSPSAAAERVNAATRSRVARRAGLGPDPSDESVAAAAATLGLSDAEAAALVRPARDEDEDLLLAGRALALTNGRKR